MNPKDREAAQAEARARLVARLGLDPTLPHLDEALTHPSYANEHKRRGAEAPRDNQRLEFLGDSVLGLCVSERLMTDLTRVDEGQLSITRASLVNTQTLADVARGLELADALRLGRGADATGERERPNVLADAFEAIVGCIYLDIGLDAARALVTRVLGDKLDALRARGGAARDAKSRLQEWLQARGLPPPRYRVVAEVGPSNAREFVTEVHVVLDAAIEGVTEADEASADGVPRFTAVATGTGRSKKHAEQAAAEAALVRLGIEAAS